MFHAKQKCPFTRHEKSIGDPVWRGKENDGTKLVNIIVYQSNRNLRYHGRWIFMKNAKNLFFAVQIEKTEKNNLQKEWRKKLFYFLR